MIFVKWLDCNHFALFDKSYYAIDDDVLTFANVFLSKHIESVPLHCIVDLIIDMSPLQRIFGLCTITLRLKNSRFEVIQLRNILYDGGFMYRQLEKETRQARYNDILLRRRNIYIDGRTLSDQYCSLSLRNSFDERI